MGELRHRDGPCPWFTEVAEYAKAHPDADLGLHLTLTSEWKTYRWGPVAPRSSVSSLVGPDGNFYSTADEFVKHAKVDEVEIEVRAQIERAISMGLKPTHLDAHMHTLYKTPEFFRVLLKVSHEYKLPIRMGRNVEPFERSTIWPLPPIRNASTDLFPAGRCSRHEIRLAALLHQSHQKSKTRRHRSLCPPGPRRRRKPSHHGHSRGLGSAWRAREFATIQRPEIRKTLQANHVKVIGWRDIQKLMQ